jgi:hypothetical protein
VILRTGTSGRNAPVDFIPQKQSEVNPSTKIIENKAQGDNGKPERHDFQA